MDRVSNTGVSDSGGKQHSTANVMPTSHLCMCVACVSHESTFRPCLIYLLSLLAHACLCGFFLEEWENPGIRNIT